MSNSLNAVVPSRFDSKSIQSFTITNGTTAKILVEQTPAVAATATTPLYWGGTTVIDLLASSTDATARDISLYSGTVLTTQSASTGAMTTTTSTIPRASGSFITDGWQVGMQCMVFAPFGTAPNAAVDGILCTIAAVAALTLTLNGTPIAALVLATGSRVAQVAPICRVSIAATAGTLAAGGAPSISLLNNGSGSIITTEKKLGANDLLIGQMPVAVSALPACVSVISQVAYY